MLFAANLLLGIMFSDFFLMESQAFDAIPLTIKKRSGIQRSNEPVTYGVPFAKTDSVVSLFIVACFTVVAFLPIPGSDDMSAYYQ